MEHLSNDQLEALGLAAARAVVGDGVKQVVVRYGEDAMWRSIKVFRVLIEHYRDGQDIGMARIRLIQRLKDDLLAIGDDQHPAVQMLDPADWNRVEPLVSG